MTAQEVLAQLAAMGSEQIKNIYVNHGAVEPFFGVRIGDMKTIQKKVKKNQPLSLELYRSGNSDAMYLAGLIADEKQVSKQQLQDWMQHARWYMHAEYTVPWLAADSGHGLELALEWIESADDKTSSGGWSTLASLVTITPDPLLPLPLLEQLLERVQQRLHSSPNRTRYWMNSYVIAIGCHVPSLTAKAKQVAEALGKVEVNLGNTACKVPAALEYIEKVEKAGKLGNKKKMARC